MDSDAPRTDRTDGTAAWPTLIIALATLAWIVASAKLFLWGFEIGFDLSGEPPTPAAQAELDHRSRILLIVFVAGPAVIAVAAAVMERVRTALVYGLIALALLCGVGADERNRALFDPPPAESEEPEPDQCIPISGSDRTCPGG